MLRFLPFSNKNCEYIFSIKCVALFTKSANSILTKLELCRFRYIIQNKSFLFSQLYITSYSVVYSVISLELIVCFFFFQGSPCKKSCKSKQLIQINLLVLHSMYYDRNNLISFPHSLLNLESTIIMVIIQMSIDLEILHVIPTWSIITLSPINFFFTKNKLNQLKKILELKHNN